MNRDAKINAKFSEVVWNDKIPSQLREMSRSKIKIAVAENIVSVGSLLKKRGYNISFPESGTKDPKVHRWLNENNYKIFITKNWIDFVGFLSRKYHIIAIDTNEDDLTVARKIERVLLNKMSSMIREPGQPTIIQRTV